jgi:hypothetical protein
VKTRTKVNPGQKGTKKLMSEYGDALVCVRYRYDVKKRKQFKTIEIIVGESDWTTPPPKFSERALVGIRIGFQEKSVQERAKALGARWDRGQRLWLMLSQ